jgi:hypothetical protein
MYLYQNTLDDIQKLSPKWEYINKYTNQYNCQYFILRSQVWFKDHKNIILKDYLAVPKIIDKINNTEAMLTFGIDTMYRLYWGIHEEDQIDFLNNYGLNSFKHILNQKKNSKQKLEMIFTNSNPDELEPLFLNDSLIAPKDENDNLRLQFIAANDIFHYLLNVQSTSDDFELDLKNECFVPDYVFKSVFDDFVRNKYINIENKSLTEKGRNYYKNIKDDPMFERLLKDRIKLLKKDGRTFENVPASVQKGQIFISDASLPIEEDDKIERKLPNNLTEIYIVIDRGYYESVGRIAAHYQTKVVRDNEYKLNKDSKNINYNIQSDNSRININSTDNSVNIISSETTNVFEDIKSALTKNISDKNELEIVLLKMDELKDSIGSSSFSEKYNNFIQSVAAHMTIILPFIPALSKLLVR